eukprot:Clim_evm45s191 gene=Clim_evmTU45s191
MSSKNENLPPSVIRRIAGELKGLATGQIDCVKVQMNEEDITDFRATIVGPPGTPYEGGHFKLRLSFTSEYPQAPPKAHFLTKIFHPNVAADGEVCVNTLKRDWKSDLGIAHILVVLKCLLIHPNPESALNEEAGKMILESYDEFAKRAKLMTEIHAKSKTAPQAAGASGTAPLGTKVPAQKKAADKKKQMRRL